MTIPSAILSTVVKIIEIAEKHPAAVQGLEQIADALLTSSDPAEASRRAALAAAAEEFIQS